DRSLPPKVQSPATPSSIDPNGKRLAPKKADEIVWKFTKAGQFEYSCLIPGHREAGMVGTIIVK
ncbi:MAG: hypothetical protein G4V63_30425, partial [Candidatus Afipia apatlaquensis]|nr:hypothetical protein [Candidatus Afipia apatlaquensis]